MATHYNAFISYKHAELDNKVAAMIERDLEHYHIPARLRKKTGYKKIERIFRDEAELPLSDNLSLSTDLGTRHRAGVGISESTDALTIIVSEETGRISIAYEGELIRNVDNDTFRNQLELIQNKPETDKKRIRFRNKQGA